MAEEYGFVEPFIEHQGERRGFWLRKPRAIGENLLVARNGMTIPPSLGRRTVILLDLRSAFGTGGHGTTEGCLAALERFLTPGEKVLDAGTGTGILAIAACKLGAGRVTAVDVDGAACAETRRNASMNGTVGRIDVVEGEIRSIRERFGLVVANLRTPTLAGLLDDLVERICDSGILILSGILERELHAFLPLLGRYPLGILDRTRLHGWVTLVLRKGGGSPAQGGPPPG